MPGAKVGWIRPGIGVLIDGSLSKSNTFCLHKNSSQRPEFPRFQTYLNYIMLRDCRIEPMVLAQIAGNTPKTIYQSYAAQVSIDKQRRAEEAFDRLKGKE